MIQRPEAKQSMVCQSLSDLDIKNLTLEDAVDIYKRDYWDKAKVEELKSDPKTHIFRHGSKYGA